MKWFAAGLALAFALVPGVAAAQGSVVSLALINADTDQPIPGFNPLAAGATLNLATLPTRNLNIRANTTGNTASVRFGLDANASYSVENVVPYALAGDTAGNYAAWTPTLGSHTVRATPFSMTGAQGTAGPTLARTFTVIDNSAPVNTAPVVNAGTDRTITLPTNSTTLTGTATDDGLPTGGTLTVAWSRVTGPAAVTFGTPAATTTTATFTVAGTYTLRLTANDSALTASDDVVVTVNSATNQAPVVNAGADRTITLPTNSTTLTGTATDDGRPTGGTLTVAWSLVTGPAAVTFGTPAATTTTATFTQAGTYTLRLTASDTALSASDTVVVVVNPPGTTFNPIRINAGGGAFVDSQGQTWAADSFFVGTSQTFQQSVSIAGTVDDPLYQSERYGQTFGYAIPVPNGTYTVDLHFAEIYWDAAGERVFDVFAENVLVMDNVDLFATAGLRTATVATHTVAVTDGVLNINFTTGVDNAKISAIQVRTHHATGDPFLHVVIEAPPLVVDYEGAGSVSVPLRGSGSHTHELGRQLASWTWREGSTTLGTTANIVTPLSVGSHLISLTIGDNNTPPRTLTDSATVDVYPIDAVGGALVRYYPAGSTPLATLIDALPAMPGFVQVLPTWQVPAAGNAIGGSPFTANTVVVLTGALQVPTAATYAFTRQGGTVTRLFVDGVAATGPVVLAAGSHTLEARFAVPSAGSLPAAVRAQVNGGASVLLDKTVTSHDQSSLPPFINASSGSSSASGGGSIILDGLGFFPNGQVAVLWGGTPVGAGSLVITPERITVAAPPGTGTVAVRVQTPNGVSNAVNFTYLAGGGSPIAFNTQVAVNVTAPTQAAWGPDGRLYVGTVNGSILAYTFNDTYAVTGVQTIATISGLSNPNILGIAFNPFDPPTPVKIYVAHSLLYGKDGTCFTGPFGYVGQVSVLTGPTFGTAQPLVTGLPTSNHDHGINGLVFDNEGDLLIATGGSTNAGIPHCNMGGLPESPLSAAILKARISKPGFNGNVTYVTSATGVPNNNQVSGSIVDVAAGVDVSVFAPGLRNPFDMVWTTKGRLYATDNGPNTAFGEASTSATTQAPVPDTPDELLAIVDGAYYGHPNRGRGRYDTRQNIYRAPTAAAILGVHTPPLAIVQVSTNGIDEYRATAFGGSLRGSLLMQRWDNVLYRAALTANGNAVSSVLEVSGGPAGLDVVTGPGGAIVGVDYTDNVLTVSLPLDTSPGVQAFDIFPWRARPDIPSSFVIGGKGFGTTASVMIGGVAATITSVSPTRIRGIIPTKAAPTDALLDVVVQTGGVTSVIPAAFRYVLPRPLGIGSWQAGTPVPAVMDEVAGGIINGVMYLVGGGSSATFAYNLVQRTWVSAPPRPLQGHHHAAEVIGGKLYLFGGLEGGSEGRVQIFNPATQTWTLGADMPFAAGSVSTALIRGKVYAAGGIENFATTSSAAVYDPVTNSWAPMASMPVGRNHAAAATDGNRLFIFGGRDGDNTVSPGFNETQIYNPLTDTWTSSSTPGSTLAPLPQPRGGMGKAAFFGGEFYVIGGETTNAGTGQVQGNVYNRVDVYNPITNTWRLERPLPTARHGMFPLAADGKIFVAGGGTVAGHSQSNLLEVFTR